ncbi:hypothetical protein KORDIASMS9_02288 [Kordia sp. SMS9]|uniref:DUF1254 domain-containing protein n=1 Tax=Kordia sp. SMS9 TaxID=2282170 RepID=UPI000E0DFD40|nr:DUF1254 domain-containing protein [Kordia sp. SMS9]AXG70059.1 hypothetical protein KORDIASMS9_02288 [Kordia sp. SMS9]
MLDAIETTTVANVIDPLNIESANDFLETTIPGIKTTFNNAFDAYIYGYPLVMMGVTLQQLNNTPTEPSNGGAGGAPMNQFALQTQWPGPEAKNVVLLSTSTLYMIASLNLKDEPIVMNLPAFTNPDGSSRFFIMQVLDGWTNVIDNTPGSRVNSQPGKYVFVGPDYKIKGNEFDGMRVIRMNTNSAWIIGRVFSNGAPADLKWINEEIYPKLNLVPLSQVDNESYIPENVAVDPVVDVSTAPFYQIQQMDASAFFGRMAAMMNYNAPLDTDKDKEMISKLEEIGFVINPVENPGISFDFTELDIEKQVTLQAGLEAAAQFLESGVSSKNPHTNHWVFPRYKFLGDYETNYKNRATIARWALGANRVEDTVYGYAKFDGDGNHLSGDFKYTIHFTDLPPVKDDAFWSVTIYNSDGTLVENTNAQKAGVHYSSIGYPTIENHPATFNDGIKLYLQADAPDKENDPVAFNNWLPIPNNEELKDTLGFIVFLRLYTPILWGEGKEGTSNFPICLVKGTDNTNWIPPSIVKVG